MSVSVTLFVTGFQQAETIERAIAGALAQTHDDLEILLCDDASSDGTAEIMEKAAADYAGPHVVRALPARENGGIVENVNRAVAAARGELIVMSGGDDEALPERCARLARAWEASGKRAALLHSAAIRMDAEGRDLGPRDQGGWRECARAIAPGPDATSPDPQRILGADRSVMGAAAAWPKDLWDRFGPLPRAAGVEDILLTFRAALSGDPILYLDEALLRWRDGGVSAARPGPPSARETLYGLPLTLLRWRAAAWACALDDLPNAALSPEAQAAARALIEDRLEAARLRLDLAAASRPGRLALLPRAAASSLARRRAEPLKLWARHLFDEAWIRYHDARRNVPGKTASEAPAP